MSANLDKPNTLSELMSPWENILYITIDMTLSGYSNNKEIVS